MDGTDVILAYKQRLHEFDEMRALEIVSRGETNFTHEPRPVSVVVWVLYLFL